MKLALIGHPVTHSRSPEMYKIILGDKLQSYELLDYKDSHLIPPLSYFAEKYDGLNITSPYKNHFTSDIIIDSAIVRRLGAVNTLAFHGKVIKATNTDVTAVEEILLDFQARHSELNLIVLGSGVMASLTKIVAATLQIDMVSLSRKSHPGLSGLDLTKFRKNDAQNIVINACSRDFIFSGKLNPEDIFWDYNYSFLPHQNTLPFLVKSYQDGQEMLFKQAEAAVRFWREMTPKLK